MSMSNPASADGAIIWIIEILVIQEVRFELFLRAQSYTIVQLRCSHNVEPVVREHMFLYFEKASASTPPPQDAVHIPLVQLH